MWKCSRCGETNEDQYDSCWQCERSKSHKPDPNEPRYRPSPFYGVASLFSPVAIALIIMLAPRSSQENGYGGAIIIILGGGISLILGVISALVGIFKGEKPIFWALIGLVLNASVLFYVTTYDSRHHHH